MHNSTIRQLITFINLFNKSNVFKVFLLLLPEDCADYTTSRLS